MAATTKNLAEARALISREFDLCRKPNPVEIAQKTGLQRHSVEVLVDEVRAARQQPRPAQITGPPGSRAAADEGYAAIQLAWLGHPSPRVRRAAERAHKAIQQTMAAIAAEGPAELWERGEQLRAERSRLDAELGKVEAQLASRKAAVACPDCDARLSSDSKRTMAVHAARSKRHKSAIAEASTAQASARDQDA